MPSRGPAIAAAAVLAVWGASTLYDMASTTYSPPEGMNTVAVAAITVFVGTAFRKEGSGDDS